MFLGQLLEEYKDADEEDKDELFKTFTNRLWISKYTFKKYKKHYRFRVNDKLLDNRVDLIKIFNEYNDVEYVVCKSFFDKKIDYIDYIRVHINNTYGYLVDKEVYYNSKYYKLLITPKKEYFKAIKAIKNGEDVFSDSIKKIIKSAFEEADKIKTESLNKKIELSFNLYKKMINGYLKRIFDNYMPIHEYENKHGWEMKVNVDGWSENNYVVKYFNKSLTGYMRNYVNNQKPKLPKIKMCAMCKIEFEVIRKNKQYCESCLITRNKERRKINNRKYYKNKSIF